MGIIHLLNGWREVTYREYKLAFNLFGGSTLSNPEILDFFHSKFNLNEKYFTRITNVGIAGAICTWDDRYLAGDKKCISGKGLSRYSLNYDEIIPPLSGERIFLP